VVRWIKSDLDAQDRSVPLRLSDSFSCVDARSDERDESGEMLTGLAKFPTSSGEVAAR
jgi:hypothetical protein